MYVDLRQLTETFYLCNNGYSCAIKSWSKEAIFESLNKRDSQEILASALKRWSKTV